MKRYCIIWITYDFEEFHHHSRPLTSRQIEIMAKLAVALGCLHFSYAPLE